MFFLFLSDLHSDKINNIFTTENQEQKSIQQQNLLSSIRSHSRELKNNF